MARGSYLTSLSLTIYHSGNRHLLSVPDASQQEILAEKSHPGAEAEVLVSCDFPVKFSRDGKPMGADPAGIGLDATLVQTADGLVWVYEAGSDSVLSDFLDSRLTDAQQLRQRLYFRRSGKSYPNNGRPQLKSAVVYLYLKARQLSDEPDLVARIDGPEEQRPDLVEMMHDGYSGDDVKAHLRGRLIESLRDGNSPALNGFEKSPDTPPYMGAYSYHLGKSTLRFSITDKAR